MTTTMTNVAVQVGEEVMVDMGNDKGLIIVQVTGVGSICGKILCKGNDQDSSEEVWFLARDISC